MVDSVRIDDGVVVTLRRPCPLPKTSVELHMEPSEIGVSMLVFIAVLGTLISLFDHRIKASDEEPPRDR